MTDRCSTDAPRRVRRVTRRARQADSPPCAPAAPTQAPEPEEPLLRVATACPRCGARPALRTTPSLATAVAQMSPAERVGTYQCQRRGCGAVYDLTARAFQDAVATEHSSVGRR